MTCVLPLCNCVNSGKKGEESDSLMRLSAVVTLKASVLPARSENGFIHVWNLKTHRVDAALDGHGRKSVYCVQTMGGKEALLRLAKQATNSEMALGFVRYMVEEEITSLISGVTESLSNTYGNVKYKNTEKL